MATSVRLFTNASSRYRLLTGEVFDGNIIELSVSGRAYLKGPPNWLNRLDALRVGGLTSRLLEETLDSLWLERAN